MKGVEGGGEKEKETVDDDKIIGTFTSRVWQFHERQCMFAIKDWFEKHGNATNNVPEALMQDGLHISRSVKGSTDHVPQQMLTKCEAFVFKNTDMRVKLVEKSLQPTPEDLEWFWGPYSESKVSGEKRSRHLLRRAGQVRSLRRMGGWVYSAHPNIPGAFIRDKEAEHFIYEVLSTDYGNLENLNMASLLSWFNMVNHIKFPYLRKM